MPDSSAKYPHRSGKPGPDDGESGPKVDAMFRHRRSMFDQLHGNLSLPPA